MHCTLLQTQTWRGVPSEKQVEVAAAEPTATEAKTEPATEPKTEPAGDTPATSTEPAVTEPKTEPAADDDADNSADATAFDEETPEQATGSTDLVSTPVLLFTVIC
jgi:hypothetical protein